MLSLLRFLKWKRLMLTKFGLPLPQASISGTWQYMTLLLIWDHKRSRLFQCCMPEQVDTVLLWQRQTICEGYLECLPSNNRCVSWAIFNSREHLWGQHITDCEVCCAVVLQYQHSNDSQWSQTRALLKEIDNVQQHSTNTSSSLAAHHACCIPSRTLIAKPQIPSMQEWGWKS